MAVPNTPPSDLPENLEFRGVPRVSDDADATDEFRLSDELTDFVEGLTHKIRMFELEGELDRYINLVRNGEIVRVSDQSFAEASHLLDPKKPEFVFGDFDPKRGQKFETWESARHSVNGHEDADIRLGRPGVIRTVAISTQWHDGNHAQAASLFASQDGETWTELLAPVPLDGHSLHVFALPQDPTVWSHVRLIMHPDGGIARLRLFSDLISPTYFNERSPFTSQQGVFSMKYRHTEEIPRPSEKSPFEYPPAELIQVNRRLASWGEPVLLSSLDLGARIAATSNQRYSHAGNLLKGEAPENMGDGWENARYRLPLAHLLGGQYDQIWDHSEWVTIQLADRGTIQSLHADFQFYNFNAPAFLQIEACDLTPGQSLEDVPDDQWTVLVKKMNAKQFSSQSDVQLPIEEGITSGEYPPAFTHVRVKIFPCGGMHRFHVVGKRVLQIDRYPKI